MPVVGMFLLDEDQKNAAEALNTETVKVRPRAIDNEFANQLGLGEIVGMYVLNVAVYTNSDEYEPWLPMLRELPIHTFDSDVIFLPPIG